MNNGSGVDDKSKQIVGDDDIITVPIVVTKDKVFFPNQEYNNAVSKPEHLPVESFKSYAAVLQEAKESGTPVAFLGSVFFGDGTLNMFTIGVLGYLTEATYKEDKGLHLINIMAKTISRCVVVKFKKDKELGGIIFANIRVLPMPEDMTLQEWNSDLVQRIVNSTISSLNDMSDLCRQLTGDENFDADEVKIAELKVLQLTAKIASINAEKCKSFQEFIKEMYPWISLIDPVYACALLKANTTMEQLYALAHILQMLTEDFFTYIVDMEDFNHDKYPDEMSKNIPDKKIPGQPDEKKEKKKPTRKKNYTVSDFIKMMDERIKKIDGMLAELKKGE